MSRAALEAEGIHPANVLTDETIQQYGLKPYPEGSLPEDDGNDGLLDDEGRYTGDDQNDRTE